MPAFVVDIINIRDYLSGQIFDHKNDFFFSFSFFFFFAVVIVVFIAVVTVVIFIAFVVMEKNKNFNKFQTISERVTKKNPVLDRTRAPAPADSIRTLQPTELDSW